MGRFAFMAQGKWIAPVCFLILLAAYHLIFGQFFPTKNGTLGHDYSRFIPDLLDGYFWFRSNGLFEPFWFTPSFCGGQPSLADQASVFYSVPQFLTFISNPISSIYATVLLFASLGFVGFYLLLQVCFGSSRQAAVLGGALFMFNGFFIHRMIVGHLSYHGMMLIPVIAYFLLRPATNGQLSTITFNSTIVGCLVAYAAYSGLISLMLPCLIAVLAIICVHRISGRRSSDLAQRLLFSTLVAVGLSATKLVATISFLYNFPRSDYSLPGVTSAWDAMMLLFSAIFFSPPDIAKQAVPHMAGLQWMLDRHEWEYGVTMVPLLIILAGSAVMLGQAGIVKLRLCRTKWAWLALIGLIIALPLALNFYTSDWNAILKQIPVIKSSSNLLRWFLIYIPLVILSASLLMDKISPMVSHRNGILIAALTALILINSFKDRSYYQAQPYWPGTIIHAWLAAHDSTVEQRIEYISAYVNSNNQVQIVDNGNDMIAKGGSQLACYNAIFGYRLEHFPIKLLHPGPVMEETYGMLNIKNPACYLYPKQNNCAPGDHFTLAQREAAQAFVNYKPYPFMFSTTQEIANLVTRVTLMLLALLLFFVSVQKIMRSVITK